MSETKSMEILKQAILLEKRGKSFYQTVAEQTDIDAITSFFQYMAEEEEKHIVILSEQFRFYQEKGSFKPGIFDKNEKSSVVNKILDKEIKEKISAASFEAAAIGAAIAMEKRAVEVYGDRAKSATDTEEKKLYEWLSVWEQGHLDLLFDIDRTVTEKVWFDNQFWPF